MTAIPDAFWCMPTIELRVHWFATNHSGAVDVSKIPSHVLYEIFQSDALEYASNVIHPTIMTSKQWLDFSYRYMNRMYLRSFDDKFKTFNHLTGRNNPLAEKEFNSYLIDGLEPGSRIIAHRIRTTFEIFKRLKFAAQFLFDEKRLAGPHQELQTVARYYMFMLAIFLKEGSLPNTFFEAERTEFLNVEALIQQQNRRLLDPAYFESMTIS